jgi:carboxymethylenebutenolidase
MDRRRLLLGLAAGASALADLPDALGQDGGMQSFSSGGASIKVELFRAEGQKGPGPGVLLLHGADGLTFGDGYRLAARFLTSAGYHVGFVHYLDRTGEQRVGYGRLRQNFPLWVMTVADAIGWLGQRPEVDPERIGIVGISLGAALALETASRDRRVKAIVDYFGPMPEGLAERRPRLPPTLILHGAADPIVPVANAHGLEKLLAEMGVAHEKVIYPGQGHTLFGPAQLDAASRTSAFLDRHLKG